MVDNSLFEKFNAEFDVEGLRKDIETAGTRERVEVPVGDYEVEITKLELGETSEQSKTPHVPQVKVWFKILAGDFKGQLIFMNQTIYGQYAHFQVHNVIEFLKSLETGIDIYFEDFVQFANLLVSVFEAVNGHYEYQLAYGENEKHFKTYNIVRKFDKE